MQPKITLLTDVVMDDDYINAFPSGKDPYIDGNGHKFTIMTGFMTSGRIMKI